MRVLPFAKKLRVVASLVEGCSVRSTERLCEVHRETVLKTGIEVGEACRRLHNVLMRDLQIAVLELDEIWSFVGKKQRRLTDEDPPEFGDQYTYVALAATQKAVVSFTVGKRDTMTTADFLTDLRSRVVNRPQITTDGFNCYPDAIALTFGEDADYAQIIKQYGGMDPTDERRYSPPRCTSSQKRIVSGSPDEDLISTSYVERSNLTMRMAMRRFTRLTTAFSRKLRNHVAAVALHFAHYNLCAVHATLRVTPAMALGITDHVWSLDELIDTALSIAPEDAPRLPAPAAPPPSAGPDDDPRQMSLLDWQPRPLAPPRPTVDMEQIDLFAALSATAQG